MRHRLAVGLSILGIILIANSLDLQGNTATAVTSTPDAGTVGASRAVSVAANSRNTRTATNTAATPTIPATATSASSHNCPRAVATQRETFPASFAARSTDDSVPLYLDQLSGTCGDTITVHAASTFNTATVIRAFRIGWYAGAGSRLIWSSAPIHLSATRFSTKSRPSIPSPKWPISTTVQIDSSWRPGLYVIATTSGSRVTGVAEFVVRNASTPKPALVIYSGLTNASYSPFGGASLYRGLDGGALATSVALQRPLILNGRVAFLKYDVATAQVLDRIGIELDSAMDTDINSSPALLASRTEVILPGHSEYWTKRMYDALRSAQMTGTNIAVLGANEIYWQARVTTNAHGQPVSMFVSRDLTKDPLAASSPQLATVRWRDDPLLDDPSAHLGESYTVTRAHGSFQILSVPSWLAKVPGLHIGAVLTDVAAGEVDGPQVTPPMSIPPATQLIGLGLLKGPGGKIATAGMTYYTAANGAASFQFGTTNWSCQLMASCPDGITSAAVRNTQWALTTSVIKAFLQPSWGTRYPSHATAPRSLSAMHSVLSPAAYGTYGSGD